MQKFSLLIFFISISLYPQDLELKTLKNLKIRNIGPANMSGRITSIDVAISNPKLIFIGAASGGFGNQKMEELPGKQFLMTNLHKILEPWQFNKAILILFGWELVRGILETL